MLKVNLNKLSFIENEEQVDKLKKLIRLHNHRLMPHQVASNIGFTLNESIELLYYLFHKKAADLFILVYHVDHLDAPIEARPYTNPFPQIPHECEVCEKVIIDKNDLVYDILFRFSNDLEILYGIHDAL